MNPKKAIIILLIVVVILALGFSASYLYKLGQGGLSSQEDKTEKDSKKVLTPEEKKQQILETLVELDKQAETDRLVTRKTRALTDQEREQKKQSILNILQ